jgi:hypothetical protein
VTQLFVFRIVTIINAKLKSSPGCIVQLATFFSQVYRHFTLQYARFRIFEYAHAFEQQQGLINFARGESRERFPFFCRSVFALHQCDSWIDDRTKKL